MTDQPTMDEAADGVRAALGVVTLRLNADQNRAKLIEYVRYLEHEIEELGAWEVASGLAVLAAGLVQLVAGVSGLDQAAVLPLVAEQINQATEEGR